MITDPEILIKYDKNELINYIVMSQIPRRYKELLMTVSKGEYNTRYLLLKYYPMGTVSSFITHGLKFGYLKRTAHAVERAFFFPHKSAGFRYRVELSIFRYLTHLKFLVTELKGI